MKKVSIMWRILFLFILGFSAGLIFYNFVLENPETKIEIKNIKQKRNTNSTLTIPIGEFEKKQQPLTRKEKRIEKRNERNKI